MIAWILGRGGLLGSALERELQNRGTRIYVPDERFEWGNAETVTRQIDAAARDFAGHATEAGAWQIHWAAGTGTMGSDEDSLAHETRILKTFLAQLETTNLVNLPGLLTFASSAGAIYAGSTDDVISERTQVVTHVVYGQEKLKQEELMKEFAVRHPSVKLLIARYSNLYGGNQSKAKKQGLITHIARCILRKQPIHIYVPFDTIRDYIAADDAARICLETADAMTESVVTKIIASEEPVSVAGIIGAFRRLARVPPRIITSAHPLGTGYPHRMRFKSGVLPEAGRTKRTSLSNGIADVLQAERMAMARSNA